MFLLFLYYLSKDTNSICLLLVDVALREAIHRFHQSTDKTMLQLQGCFRPRSPEMNIYLAKKATKKGRNIQKLSTRAITEWYQGGINCCMFAVRLQPTTTTASRNKARPRSWTSRRVSRNWDRLTGEILGQMTQCHETSWNLVSKPNAAHWRQAFATSHSWVFRPAAPYIVPSDVFFF